MRPFWLCLLAFSIAAAGTSTTARAAEPPRNFDDAALRAVHFVDDRVGWAVGDEGVIWTTIDAGANWERQPSGTRASLRSVHFVNPYVGWVAGREELPGGGGSAGVVLYTRDGGLKWRRILVGSVPGLHLVRFVDERTGYLGGDGSDQFPTGLFATTDGGKTWQPVPGPRAPSWRGGDFTAEGGALAGAWGRLATVRRGQVFTVDMDSLGGRALCGLQLRNDGGVAVGQGGLVLLSSQGRGSSWHYADLKMSRDALACWDFHAVGGVGKHVWAVGRPGSVALYSPDGGKTWQARKTGQNMPLHAVTFRDADRGWAVGELGTVIATTDGGKTWRVQRRGGLHLAALAVHARAAGVCPGTLARVGAQDGYLTGCLTVTSAEPGSAALARVSEACRTCEAVRQSGGALSDALWAFPVGSHLAGADRQALLKAWDRQHGDRAAGQLLAQLVLAIRMYAPPVLLTDSPDAKASGCDALVAEAMREALKQAADPNCFPEQLKTLGLTAHRAGKLYSAWPSGASDAQVSLDLTAVSPRLGTTLRELAAAPAALLGQPAPPSQRSYRLVAGALKDAASHRELMEGTNLAAGGLARRELPPDAGLSDDAFRLARHRANLWAITEAPATSLTSPDRMLAQVGPMLNDMPQETGARLAHGLARQYARRGQWTLARETYMLLAERYPTHPLAAQAVRWLILHQGSSEARRRHELGQFLVVGEMKAGVPVGSQKLYPEKSGPTKKPGDETPQVPTFGKQEERQIAYLNTQDDTRRWYQGCLALEKRLGAMGPLHAGDPAVQFCVQAARRQLGKHQEALDWYRDFAARQADGPWRSAALAELWLNNRVGPAPKPVLLCRPTDARPYLDGKLDDACWATAPAVPLSDATGATKKGYPTEARMTHDRDFVYLAVKCGVPQGEKVEPAASPRTRDGDLRKFDRVSLMLDLDRDYATCFHLMVDQRGCVADDCWGDTTWGPRWFVAVHRDASGWTLEAAIPRNSLTGDHITPGKTWAVNVVRTLPGRGVQAFSLPAEAPEEATRPEGMGLLMFTQDAASQASRGAGPGEAKSR